MDLGMMGVVMATNESGEPSVIMYQGDKPPVAFLSKSKDLTIAQKLEVLQKHLVAPKNQYNSFGKFNYRNCEDILQALKPLQNGWVIILTDDIGIWGDRVFLRSTATIIHSDDNPFAESISVTALAEIPREKKGMDVSQITGSASSYARKYALCGLLAIDDNKDADTPVSSEAKKKSIEKKPNNEETLRWISERAGVHEAALSTAGDMTALQKAWGEMNSDFAQYKSKFEIVQEYIDALVKVKDGSKLRLEKETADANN
jgi:hypothetical protein